MVARLNMLTPLAGLHCFVSVLTWGMKKSDAIAMLGGTVAKAARACRITGPAVSQWPDELTAAIEDRVTAALARQGAAGGSGVAAIPDISAGEPAALGQMPQKEAA